MVVLRPWLWQRLLAVACVVVAALGIAGGGMAAGGWLEPAGWAAAALSLPLIWRADRVRVELRDDAVAVVNYWRTLRIPWPEVEHFDYVAGALVVRTDKRVHPISVFTPQGIDLPFVHRQCQNAVLTMEEFREQRQLVR